MVVNGSFLSTKTSWLVPWKMGNISVWVKLILHLLNRDINRGYMVIIKSTWLKLTFSWKQLTNSNLFC